MTLASPPPYGVLGVVQDSSDRLGFPDNLTGRVVRGRYRLEGILHRGTKAVVFRATYLGNNKRVAVKIRSPGISDGACRAFAQEALLASELEHDRLPRLLDRGETEDGQPFVTMELLEGMPLRDSKEPLAPTQAVKLIAQALDGLRYLHSRGITHSDLCPNNLFVATSPSEPHGQIKILGLDSVFVDDGTHSGPIILSGLLRGTPGYMAPEQITGQSFDHRADLYALGVIFYELLTGESAWTTTDPEDLLEQQVGCSVPALPDEIRDFDPLVQRLAARDPTDRFPSATAAFEALENHLLGIRRPSGALAVPALVAAAPVVAAPVVAAPVVAAPVATGTPRSRSRAVWTGATIGLVALALGLWGWSLLTPVPDRGSPSARAGELMRPDPVPAAPEAGGVEASRSDPAKSTPTSTEEPPPTEDAPEAALPIGSAAVPSAEAEVVDTSVPEGTESRTRRGRSKRRRARSTDEAAPPSASPLPSKPSSEVTAPPSDGDDSGELLIAPKGRRPSTSVLLQ